MDTEKFAFLTEGSFEKTNSLSADTKPAWGKMSVQHMLEHLADFYNVSADKIKMKLLTPEEQLPAYMAFLHSDKVFRENTKAPAELIGDEPLPLRLASLEAAKEDYRLAVNSFVQYFKNNETARTLHPTFGMLNFEEWVKLHYKHVVHHMTQFNLLSK